MIASVPVQLSIAGAIRVGPIGKAKWIAIEAQRQGPGRGNEATRREAI